MSFRSVRTSLHQMPLSCRPGGLVITANVIPTEFLIMHFAEYLEEPGGMANLPHVYVHHNSYRLFYRFGPS
jgi:hypothetical protein